MGSGTYAQSAEFARLFNFFESLVARGKASNDAPEAEDADADSSESSSGSVADDSADDERHDNNLPPTPPPCDNSARSSTPPPSDDTQRAAFVPKINHPFTFKLMIHKLYGLEEWMAKVQNTLVSSRVQFKPLSETHDSRIASANIEITGEVKKGLRQRSQSVIVTRTRSGSLHNVKHASTPPTARTRSRSVCDLGPRATKRPNTAGVKTDLHLSKRRCMDREKPATDSSESEPSPVEWTCSRTQTRCDFRATDPNPQERVGAVDPLENKNRTCHRVKFGSLSEPTGLKQQETVVKDAQSVPAGMETSADKLDTRVCQVRDTLKRRVVS